ncbi:MAG TPA: hypothetical protein VJT81_01395 [Burkholderiales bacterium]|nr:hypothetical protein [Burkholderiales bacterium]
MKNLWKKTGVFILVIAPCPIVIGSALLAPVWIWFEPVPIRWTVSLGLAFGYTAVLASGVAWRLF